MWYCRCGISGQPKDSVKPVDKDANHVEQAAAGENVDAAKEALEEVKASGDAAKEAPEEVKAAAVEESEKALEGAKAKKDAVDELRKKASAIDFSDLIVDSWGFGNVTSSAGCTITDTALRAISLDQLEIILAHTARRLKQQPWELSRELQKDQWMKEMISELDQVNLYDLNLHVILLATAERQCSMTELLASGDQSPDFFVSHWWGEPVVLSLKCLKQHSEDRGLENKKGWYEGEQWGCEHGENTKCKKPHPGYLGGRSPLYWICAHANNRKSHNASLSVIVLPFTHHCDVTHSLKSG